MLLVFIILIPFWRFKLPKKKFFKPLLIFSISMGVLVYVFMNLSLYPSSIISPIILGSQLAIPFGILASALILEENISKNKWLLIVASFIGILIILNSWLRGHSLNKLIWLYWFSPVLIYISYIHGQLDVIPIFFLFLS